MSTPAQANKGGYPYADFNGPGSNASQYMWTDKYGNMFSGYGFAYRNCTDFVAWKLNAANQLAFVNNTKHGRYGNALTWAEMARSNGYVVDMNPVVGAVAWWGAYAHGMSGYGHVAWVSAVDGDKVTIEEYNNPGGGVWGSRTFAKNKVSGYIHFKDLTGNGGGTSGTTNPTDNGKFVSYHGAVYRIAGGAPLYVSGQDAPHLPEWATATPINDAQWASLRPFPADGTYLSDVQTGAVYITAGGAPMYISGADAPYFPNWTTATRVPHWDFVHWQRLRQYPADGYYLREVQSGFVYNTAGGAPFYVSGQDAPALPQWQYATPVPRWEFVNLQHLRRMPADGAYISDVRTGAVYITLGGAPMYISGADASHLPNWASAARVSHWEFESWSVLRPYPADGHYLRDVQTGAIFVTAGGAPLYVSGQNAQYLPQWQYASPVPHWELQNWGRLRQLPVDGTYVIGMPSTKVFQMVNGIAVQVTSGPLPVATRVDDWAIVNQLGGTL